MGFEVAIITFLQSANNTFSDYLIFILTHLGDEIFFIAVAGSVYWCINKRFAYRLVNVYFVSLASIELLKNTFARPRPFDAHSDTIRSIISDTHGYSFPSGHSHSIASLSTQMAIYYRKTDIFRKVLVVGIIATLTVMFTRMYLGQHYLSDVIVGASIGVGLAIGLTALFELLGNKEENLFLVIAPLCIVIYIVLELTGSAGLLVDVVKVLGAYVGFTGGYYLEKKYVGYNVKSGKFYKHLIKIVMGLVGILIIKEGLKIILPDVAFLTGFLRYLLVSLFASFVAPLIFKKLKL